MYNYKTLKFPKGYLIYEEMKYPRNVFYIITKGKVISYSINSNSEIYKEIYGVGYVVGLINIAANEPYFITLEVVEDVEAIEMNLETIINLNTNELIEIMYNYINSAFEVWLSKYYICIVKNKMDLYHKENIFKISKIYETNGFFDASYKLYDEYINDIHNDDKTKDKAIKEMSKLSSMPPEVKLDGNILQYDKNQCIYTELKPTNNLYMIKQGKVGIYNVINNNLILRDVYSKNYIFNNHKPISEYTPLLTSAICLEPSYIKSYENKEFLEMITKDKELRSFYIKIMSFKIANVFSKIKSLNNLENKTLKLYIIIFSILKMETLFSEQKELQLSHTIDDIKNSYNFLEEDIINASNNIKSIEIVQNKYIRIANINNFFIEYYKYYNSSCK